MMDNNIIHRDLKLMNIIMHFPGKTEEIINMTKK